MLEFFLDEESEKSEMRETFVQKWNQELKVASFQTVPALKVIPSQNRRRSGSVFW